MPKTNDEKNSSIYKQWADLFHSAGDAIGREFNFNDGKLTKFAEDAGFTDIYSKSYTIPTGTWPRDRRLKEFGAATNHYMELSMEGFALYPIGEIMGWSKMEIDVLVAKLRTALLNNRNRNTGTM